MFINMSTWLIIFGVALGFYGISEFFRIQESIQEIKYIYLALGVLLTSIPLAMFAFRVKAGSLEPKLQWWGKIIIGASFPAGFICVVAGFPVFWVMAVDAVFRTRVLKDLNNPWLIFAETLLLLFIITFALTMWLWDQATWVTGENRFVLDEQGNVLYPDQLRRYRLFQRNGETVSIALHHRVEAVVGSYRAVAEVEVDFKEARALGVSKIDSPNFEKELHAWGERVLLDALPGWPLSYLNETAKTWARQTIQKVPMRFRLSYVEPSWRGSGISSKCCNGVLSNS